MLYDWHKSLLRDVATAMVAKWEPKLGVHVERVFLQRMKTRWGGCNHRAGNIRLNTELVKSPATLSSTSSSTRCCTTDRADTQRPVCGLLDQHYPRGARRDRS